ncbi:MAG: glycosyltransferase family 9 protein [Pseudarcicella sp.]|nr:glycosyltransferase family 9 protein [Pseudarcicella sp.]MBP6409911.1 glycosyltransferase family 9 protein [Pseudarcicella sp.]
MFTQKKIPLQINKILVVHIGRIGDLILAMPLFEVLKSNYPQAKIHILASVKNYTVAENNPFIDKVHLHKKGFHILHTLLKLRNEKFDLWIDPKAHRSSESQWLAKLNNAKFKIGFHPENKIFDYALASEQTNPEMHMIHMNLKSLEPLGIKITDKILPKLFITKENINKFDIFCNTNNIKDFYCVNLSGSAKEREWENEKWIEFLKTIQKDISSIILISSPEKSQEARTIAEKVEKCVYYSTSSINEIYPTIKNTQMVISPDTSIVHLASAYNRPVLGLYGYASFRFSPLSDLQEVVTVEENEHTIKEISIDNMLKSYNRLKRKIENQTKNSNVFQK